MDKSTHILHVLNSAHGGSAISTFELIESLASRGIISSLVCFDNANAHQKRKIRELVEGRVLFIPLYWMNKRIRSAWWKRPAIEALSLLKTRAGHRYQKQISKLIHDNGVNIVHTSTILNPEGAIAARQNQLPHLWHVRELVGPSYHYHFYNYRHWSHYVLKHSNYLIANSSVTQKCLFDFFPESIIKCIPNGIEVNKFTVKIHTNEKVPLVIGMIGSVTTRWKNHAFFIRVAECFKNRTEVIFKIYGSLPPETDTYYSQLLQLVNKLQVNDILKFEPFMSPSDIMKEIDILFHPTELESFGRIFVEAMAAGVPVVGINKGGAREMVVHGENGFLVESENVDDATQRLIELINNAQLRNAFGMNGRKSVEKNYTIDLMSERMIEIYKTVSSS